MISIIIPVYNDAEAINSTLVKIKENKFNDEFYEIIVVDNGSTDNTLEIVRKYKNVKLVLEHENLNSPYSARNRGIEISTGDIIILLDSTCRPSHLWLKTGIEALNNSEADIIAGGVDFDFQDKITAGKIYDSITNIKVKESVERNVAKTANLFIKKEVFNKIGMFPEGVRSGADVRWTRKATNLGFKLEYCEDAKVYKIARGTVELFKKQWRVGLGQPKIWIEEDEGVNYRRYISLNRLFPPNPKAILYTLEKKGFRNKKSYLIKLTIIGYIIKLIMLISNLTGLRRIKKI